jgi:hypothetical protein
MFISQVVVDEVLELEQAIYQQPEGFGQIFFVNGIECVGKGFTIGNQLIVE